MTEFERQRAEETERALRSLQGVDVPEALRGNIALFLRLVRRVLDEYQPELRQTFDRLLEDAIAANAPDDPASSERAFLAATAQVDDLPVHEMTLVTRAFAVFFHLANICEENYRVSKLRDRERELPEAGSDAPANDIAVAYHRLAEECGPNKANVLLRRLEFRPVFTAHPTEARRKAVEGKIRRISELLDGRPLLSGADLVENERRMLQEIDALLRTSPIALSRPTPEVEAGTIIDLFDSTLFDLVPDVYRRFDDWVLGERAGTVPAVCPAFSIREAGSAPTATATPT